MKSLLSLICFFQFSLLIAQNPMDWKVLIHPLDSLSAGDTLTVSIGRNYDTGYSWKFDPDSASMKQWEVLEPVMITDSAGFYRYDQQFIYWGIRPDTLNWQFSLQKATDSVWFAIPELILFPKLITEQTDTTLRPEKPIYVTVRPWWQYALWIAGGLLLVSGLIAWLISRKNRKNGVDAMESVLPNAPSAWEVFNSGMDNLKNRQSGWMDDFRLFYAELIDLLKTYLESVSGKPVREMTSWEFNQWLNAAPQLKSALPDMDLLLQRADLIKFARQTTLQDQMDADFADVKASVERIHRSDLFTNGIKPDADKPSEELIQPAERENTGGH